MNSTGKFPILASGRPDDCTASPIVSLHLSLSEDKDKLSSPFEMVKNLGGDPSAASVAEFFLEFFPDNKPLA